jgi:hypothetical protein
MNFPNISFHIQCDNLEEATIAHDAVVAFRQGRTLPTAPRETSRSTETLADRIMTALTKSPLNQPRRLVLEQLQASVGWLSYNELKASFEREGLKKEQAQAAIRDLSWQMKTFLPVEDTAQAPRAIEVLVDRSRTDSAFQYRLTSEGRIAVENFLSRQDH